MKKTSATLAAFAALLLSSGGCLEAQPASLEDAQAQLQRVREQVAMATAEAQRSALLAQEQARNVAKEALETARVRQLIQLAQAAAPAPPSPVLPEPPQPPVEQSDPMDLNLPDEAGASHNAALADYALLQQGRGTGPTLVVSPARAEAGEIAQIEEDLAVMSRILEKAVARVAGRDAAHSVLGINLSNPFSWRQSQSLYLDGYGALFVLNVRCPLLPPPGKEEAKEDKPDNSTWEQTKRELYGGRPASADWTALLRIQTDRAEEYDPARVESLRKSLIEALKNGGNIRHLKDDDAVTVVVVGPSAAQTKRGEAKSESGRSRRRVQAATGDTRSTTLTIRVKKSEVDAFAQGKLTVEQFAEKATIAVY